MTDSREPVSAFAVYSKKRKAAAPAPNAKKFKKGHLLVSTSANGVSNETRNSKKAGKRNKRKPGKVSVATGVHIMKKNVVSKQNIASNASKKKKMQKTNSKIDKSVAQSLAKILPASGSEEKIVIPRKSKILNERKVNILKVKPSSTKKRKSIKTKGQSNNNTNQLHRGVADLSTSYDLSKSFEESDPLSDGHSLFGWLIEPLTVDDFLKQFWEKAPVHVKRGRPYYYKHLMSTQLLDSVLRESHIQFTKNIDITSYTNGVRETHNPIGRALPSVVWDYYLNGCSVRMLNPQTYIPKLHELNARLQEFFNCFVGANSYLTPPDSQGFAPHYDDIEAFILQIEGKKRWRLYQPQNKNEFLSRFSSKNFDQSEIGEPIMDVVVNAGDLLYFPRGTIHQGETIDGTHSLHITLSVYQRNSWGDFLEKLLPEALQTAINNDIRFREGLPLDYLRHNGFAHIEKKSPARAIFIEKVKSLLSSLVDYIDTDSAADAMAKNHVYDFLPPVFRVQERECSVLEDGEKMTRNGIVENRVEIEPDTRIRLLRSHCIRLVKEEGTFRIYYSTENSKEYHEYEPQFLEIGEEFVTALKELILRYPEYIRVEELPIEEEDAKIQIAKDLWEKCIIVTENPLCVID